jgi:hypothetical protein
MPSAGSPIRDGLTLRFAHSLVCLLPCPTLCVPLLMEYGSWMDRTRCPINAWGFVSPVPPIIQQLIAAAQPETQRASRVSSDYFQRTIVKYTAFDLMTDRGLCPVLRTRPGLAPPQICLPSTLSGTGHTCTPDQVRGRLNPRFCLRLPSGAHCYNTLALGYPSPLSGWVWTLPDTCVIISDITI